MDKYLNILKNSGAKLTRPRKVVLEVLYKSDTPLSITELYNRSCDVVFSSVYRTVLLFRSLGIVNQIILTDNTYRYELVYEDHFHGIICSHCGYQKRIDKRILREIEKSTEFKITDHSILFKGVCPKCR